jgi:PPK2 family polyphosphate:nucleotide phosphotransferase
MKFDWALYRVRKGEKVNLRKRPTAIKQLCGSKEAYEKARGENIEELTALQNLLYASNCYSLLLIFQAMDAAGKDSAIKHVMSGVNPQGCQVFSFKHPSVEELEHDFLWRTTRTLPERGRIGIFNRSYYEEVLIVRVHPEILESQNLPEKLRDHKDVWDERFRSIRDFESHLHRNGTVVVKFFLHISKEEQRRRFLKRIADPEKNWKFNISDVKERKHWDDYMDAYEACLSATSTKTSPWYIIPADHKPDARLIIAEIIIQTLKKLKMSYPRLTKTHLEELKTIRKVLERD